MNENMTTQEKAKEFIRNNFVFGVVAMVCLVYIIRGLIQINLTGKTVWEILADGALAFVFGYCIGQLLSIQGVTMGNRNDDVIRTSKLHAETINKVMPWWFLLEGWCVKKNATALLSARTQILSGMGMRYTDYFDSDGYAKPYIEPTTEATTKEEKELRKARRKTYYKAVRVKLSQLSIGRLTQGSVNEMDRYNFGQSKSEHIKQGSANAIYSKVLTAILFGVFGMEMLEFSWANLIWTAIQAASFVLFGTMSLLMNYFWITTDYREGEIKKIDTLDEFYSDMSQSQSPVLEAKEN